MGNINPLDNIILINKKITISCQVDQFNIRSAIISDICFAKIKYKIPATISTYNVIDCISKIAAEVGIIENAIPVIKYGSSEHFY